MEAKLVVLAPAEIVNTEFNLQLPVTIGRGRDAKIKLVHGQISRLHCEVYEDHGRLMARDLGSLNGTFVDAERISDAELKPGGTLNIGSVLFRAVYGEMPPESGDSAVEFGAPRIKETVRSTSTVMGDALLGLGNAAAAEPDAIEAETAEPASAEDDDLGMLDFAEEPMPTQAATTEEPMSSIPVPAPTAPLKAPAIPPASSKPADEANVDDWLNIVENDDSPNPAAEDDDLQSFFGNLK